MEQPSRKTNTDNRRDFLRESLMLAAVPAALAGNVAQAAFTTSSSTQTIKLGVLGCGRRGMQLARAALSSSAARVQVAALADLFPDRVQQTFRAINSISGDRALIGVVERFTGMRAAEQIAASDVDAVILSAAPGFRPSHLRALIEAGKHVYIERPLATSIADTFEVAELASAAASRGLAVQFGMQHRYQPFFASMVDQLHQGIIGRPTIARIALERPADPTPVRSKNVSEHEFRLRHWQRDLILGGHPILEQLSGQFDLINWIVGSTPLSAKHVATSEHDVAVQMSYASGLTLDCHLRSTSPGKGCGLSVLVQGTTGWCDVLKGNVYDQQNHLIWSSTGGAADSMLAVDCWLASLLVSGSRECPGDALSMWNGHVATTADAVNANLTALLGQLASQSRSAVAFDTIQRG